MHVTTRDAKVISRFDNRPRERATYAYFEWHADKYGLFSTKKIYRGRQIFKAFGDREKKLKERGCDK